MNQLGACEWAPVAQDGAMTSVQIKDVPDEPTVIVVDASVLDVPLITADGRLGKAPRVRCHLEVLAP